MISCFLPRLSSTKNGFLQRQEAKSHGKSLQEAINRAQQFWHETRDRGQSRRKPNMTDSLCRRRKLADSFIPCVLRYSGHKYHSYYGGIVQHESVTDLALTITYLQL